MQPTAHNPDLKTDAATPTLSSGPAGANVTNDSIPRAQTTDSATPGTVTRAAADLSPTQTVAANPGELQGDWSRFKDDVLVLSDSLKLLLAGKCSLGDVTGGTSPEVTLTALELANDGKHKIRVYDDPLPVCHLLISGENLSLPTPLLDWEADLNVFLCPDHHFDPVTFGGVARWCRMPPHARGLVTRQRELDRAQAELDRVGAELAAVPQEYIKTLTIDADDLSELTELFSGKRGAHWLEGVPREVYHRLRKSRHELNMYYVQVDDLPARRARLRESREAFLTMPPHDPSHALTPFGKPRKLGGVLLVNRNPAAPGEDCNDLLALRDGPCLQTGPYRLPALTRAEVGGVPKSGIELVGGACETVTAAARRLWSAGTFPTAGELAATWRLLAVKIRRELPTLE